MKQERQGKKVCIRAIRMVSLVVSLVIIAAVIVAVSVGIYRVKDTYDLKKEGSSDVYAAYRPLPEAEPGFDEFAKENPDVIGWLNVYGTTINYPIVQAGDNWKYLNTDAFGKYSLTGSIFLDCGNARAFSDFNSILYGHNMTPAVMFGDLKQFKDREFFDSHPYGDLYYGGEHHGIAFFKQFNVDAYDSRIFTPAVKEESEKEAYLSRIIGAQGNKKEMRIGFSDRLVLLSTCSNEETNLREILVGVITDETYPDTFTGEEYKRNTGVGSIDSQDKNIFKRLPVWLWVLLIVLAGLAVIILLVGHGRKRKRGDREDE